MFKSAFVLKKTCKVSAINTYFSKLHNSWVTCLTAMHEKTFVCVDSLNHCQQYFSHVGMGLPGLNSTKHRIIFGLV